MPSRRTAARVVPAQRAAGDERLGITQRVQEDERFVDGPVASGSVLGGGRADERSFLKAEVDVNVDLVGAVAAASA
jgi:hypothetical protein